MENGSNLPVAYLLIWFPRSPRRSAADAYRLAQHLKLQRVMLLCWSTGVQARSLPWAERLVLFFSDLPFWVLKGSDVTTDFVSRIRRIGMLGIHHFEPISFTESLKGYGWSKYHPFQLIQRTPCRVGGFRMYPSSPENYPIDM